MEISIRLGAGFRPETGNPRLALDLPEGATVTDLITRLGRLHPELEGQLPAAVAVSAGRHLAGSEPLTRGQEVVLLLPISGGA